MTKKFLGFICIVYSLIIGYVWIFDKMKNFLAPQMQLYLKLSLFPIFIIGLVLTLNNKVHYKFKISDTILLFPIAMLILAGDGKLTASLATNRMTNYNMDKVFELGNNEEPKQEQQKPETNKEEQNKEELENKGQEKYDSVNKEEQFTPYFDIVDANYNELAFYLTYQEKAVKYENEKIRVRGFVVTDSPYLKEGFFAFGKYGVSCCTADAGFSGFVVKYNDFQVKNNAWYEIEGILKRGKDIEDYDIMYIEIINIKEINSDSEEQYVYPCYTYDNGLCKEVTKYNLER